MTLKNLSFRIKILVQAGILATGLATTAAWSYEAVPVQAPQTRAQKALSTLQDMADHVTSKTSDLAVEAMSMIGIKYRYGGNTPETGLDCSGLVRYVFKAALGTDLPRTAAEISRVGEKIDSHDLQPGDLVFYNTLRRGFSHVGIYLGDSKFIHSPSAGGEVRIESMNIAYWKKRFSGARRIIEDSDTPQPQE
ncbi:MAG TPA: C40 family peptidase [Herbaspirillum sp.]|jgi:cell wall-associated NlpC family hydrolase